MVAAALVKKYGCSVVGLDQSEQMLARARRLAPDARSSAISSSKARPSGCRSPTPSSTALTFTYLLRYVDDPAATLRELARVVKPGRADRLARVRRPDDSGAQTVVVRPHTRGVAGPGSARFAEWYEVGRFLGPSIAGFYEKYPIASIVEMWEQAGIEDVAVKRMSFGAGVVMWGQARWRLTQPASGRRSTRCAPAAGAISSRCCTRPTRPGI